MPEEVSQAEPGLSSRGEQTSSGNKVEEETQHFRLPSKLTPRRQGVYVPALDRKRTGSSLSVLLRQRQNNYLQSICLVLTAVSHLEIIINKREDALTRALAYCCSWHLHKGV